MKTLKLLIKRVSLIKSMILCASISNKSLMEEATKCLFRTSLRSTHSTRMCFTVSGPRDITVFCVIMKYSD